MGGCATPVPETLPCVDDYTSQHDVVRRVVSRYRTYVVPGVSDIEDIEQDAWEGILRGQKIYDGERYEPDTWNYLKASGRIKDRHTLITKRKSHGAGVNFVSLFADGDDDESSREVADDHADDPLECVEHTERAAAIESAMSALTVRERAAITMFYFQEISQADIAKQFKITEHRTKEVIANARRKMRAHLSQAERVCPQCLRPSQRIIREICHLCYHEQRNRARGRQKQVRKRICPRCHQTPHTGHAWAGGVCRRCYNRARWDLKVDAKLQPTIDLVRSSDLSSLTLLQRNVVTKLFIDRVTAKDVQQQLGISQGSLIEARSRALKVLRGEATQTVRRRMLRGDEDMSVLSDAERNLVTQFYVQNRQGKDIARDMGISVNAFMGRLDRAMKKLTARDGT